MACLQNLPAINAESEMEEGEIVDELDDLSDISSEEEFLLRQRLEVLEDYNNVLERKKARRSSIGTGTKQVKDVHACELSEISATEFDDPNVPYKNIKVQRSVKLHRDKKRKKEFIPTFDENAWKPKVHKKQSNKLKKQQVKVKFVHTKCKSSDESEDEYKIKRKKLANAVIVNKNNTDKSTLSTRLKRMLCISNPKPIKSSLTKDKLIGLVPVRVENVLSTLPEVSNTNYVLPLKNNIAPPKNITAEVLETQDLCTDDDNDDDVKIINGHEQIDTVDAPNTNNNHDVSKTRKFSEKDSDDDLESLRQHALKTKSAKIKKPKVDAEDKNKDLSKEEDNDTAELRLICLKSALLKKAIELKQKQKLKKRLSSMSINAQDDFYTNKIESDNNTDIESVDMDIGSDADDRFKDLPEGIRNRSEAGNQNQGIRDTFILNSSNSRKSKEKNEEELEEDEDLLRAKLLTSLSKNLANLESSIIIEAINQVDKNETPEIPKIVSKPAIVPEEKRFIIKLDETDSEGEHEATKNLTKMHTKLSEQGEDFQQKLDLFLKSTRMEVEKTTTPSGEQPAVMKKPEKFVAKAVNHLPKSEQIEYRNLVKRMAELEKIKQSRQSPMNIQPIDKDTLKPRNIATDAYKLVNAKNLEEQIALSRKRIAAESAKMLSLKEEATKLSQKYKIVATELRNIATAITFNKKQQRSVQNCLTKIRLNHQSLLKGSTTSLHSKVNGRLPNSLSNKILSVNRQKENNPVKKVNTNVNLIKTLTVSVVNDVKKDINANQKLFDNASVNNRIVVGPKPVKQNAAEIGDTKNTNSVKDLRKPNRIVEVNNVILEKTQAIHPIVEKGGGSHKINEDIVKFDNWNRNPCTADDYTSPLQALGSTNWEADPNAILCPFEVDGDCKDTDCKYLHTKTQSIQ